MMHVEPPSPHAVRALPLLSWASRFRDGRVDFSGRLVARVVVEIDGVAVVLEPGPVCGRVDFEGGGPPSLLAAALDATQLSVGEAEGRTLAVAGEVVVLDDAPLPALRMDLLLEALLDHVHDLSVEVAAWPGQELLVKLSGGVEATVGATDVVTLKGTTCGPPGQPLLDAPLVCTVGGSGLRVSHQKLRWLSTLAKVRIQEASLHPCGRVDLQADTRVGLHRVGRGLDRVSQRLSEVVRRSPRFARVRAFLQTLD
jgi:hypothetical protein